MADYQPLGPAQWRSSVAGPGRRARSYADRREAAADRLSMADELLSGLEAQVEQVTATGIAVDPDGVLVGAVSALIPLALRTDGYDVVVSLGPDHAWGARLRRTGDRLHAELLTGAEPAPPPSAPSNAEAGVAAALADLVRSGEVGRR